MEALKDWAATIAGIVVLAGLLEMLVPSGTMKRYVQLAMGLLVLLTLMQPVISVLSHTRDLAWETEATWAAPNLALSSVMAQADQLRQDSRERQVSLYQARLEEAAARRAEAVLGGRAVTAHVALGPSPADGGAPPIQSVILEVGPDSAALAGAGPGTATGPAMAPVQSVEIDLGPGAAPGQGNEGGQALQPGETTLSPDQDAAARRAVAELLAVAIDRVTVRDKS